MFVLVIPGVWDVSVVAKPVTDENIEGVLMIAHISNLLVLLVKNHSWNPKSEHS